MNMILRIIVGLWGVGFGLLAVRGILDPNVFLAQFGFQAPGASINSIRSDFGAFFLVSAVGALWGAWQPSKAKLLLCARRVVWHSFGWTRYWPCDGRPSVRRQ